MARFLRRTTGVVGSLLGLALALAALQPAAAEGVVNASSWTGTAIEGYDPVAYFEQGRPVEGDSDYAHEWMGAALLTRVLEVRGIENLLPSTPHRLPGGVFCWLLLLAIEGLAIAIGYCCCVIACVTH